MFEMQYMKFSLKFASEIKKKVKQYFLFLKIYIY